MTQDPSPTRGGSVEIEDPGLRPLAAFLDLALPLDRHCAILDLAPAPEQSPGDLLAALDRALADEVEIGWLVPDGVDEDGVPTYNMRAREPDQCSGSPKCVCERCFSARQSQTIASMLDGGVA